MTICDLCTEHPAIWLLSAESADGSGMSAVACRRDVDIARALLSRVGPPTVIPLDESTIPEG